MKKSFLQKIFKSFSLFLLAISSLFVLLGFSKQTTQNNSQNSCITTKNIKNETVDITSTDGKTGGVAGDILKYTISTDIVSDDAITMEFIQNDDVEYLVDGIKADEIDFEEDFNENFSVRILTQEVKDVEIGLIVAEDMPGAGTKGITTFSVYAPIKTIYVSTLSIIGIYGEEYKISAWLNEKTDPNVDIYWTPSDWDSLTICDSSKKIIKHSKPNEEIVIIPYKVGSFSIGLSCGNAFSTVNVTISYAPATTIIVNNLSSSETFVAGDAGQWPITAVASFVAKDLYKIDRNVIWSLEIYSDNLNPIMADWLSIDSNGVISWTSKAIHGVYSVCAVATSKVDNTLKGKSQMFEITFEYAQIKWLKIKKAKNNIYAVNQKFKLYGIFNYGCKQDEMVYWTSNHLDVIEFDTYEAKAGYYVTCLIKKEIKDKVKITAFYNSPLGQGFYDELEIEIQSSQIVFNLIVITIAALIVFVIGLNIYLLKRNKKY